MTETISAVRDCLCYKFTSGCFRLVPKDCRRLFSFRSRIALLLRSVRGYTCYYLKSGNDVLTYCFIKHNYLHKYAFMQKGDLIVNPYFTLPAYRGRGYATALLERVIADLPTGSRVWAVVVKGNFPSFAVLRKIGFQQVGDCGVRGGVHWSLKLSQEPANKSLLCYNV